MAEENQNRSPGGFGELQDTDSDESRRAKEKLARRAEDATAENPLSAEGRSHSSDDQVSEESRIRTRRSFLVAGVAAGAGYGFYYWSQHARESEMQPEPLREAFDSNAALSRFLLRDRVLAPTYPLSRAEALRVNGVAGVKRPLIIESYRLQVVGSTRGLGDPAYSADVTGWEYLYSDAKAHEDPGRDTKIDPKLASAPRMAPAGALDQAMAREGRTEQRRPRRGLEEAGESRSTLGPGTSGLLLTLQDLQKLPRHELVTQFKCVEGWSQVVHWAGFRMMDFLELYPPVPGTRYVYMETPDGDYYTGYDLEVCRHPQTLLVTEMMGAPLTQLHGAPLRLHMPTKYGYKQIKRIGLIAYTRDKPDDYWTRLGYDWYAGL
ncbi:molybdopterin-binding oxidoreductase [Acidipila sp. EB88]|nr:molybdopterin-binding oxidoreductase [Acidipila sp. EB88]